jgi:hypothetical protein
MLYAERYVRYMLKGIKPWHPPHLGLFQLTEVVVLGIMLQWRQALSVDYVVLVLPT